MLLSAGLLAAVTSGCCRLPAPGNPRPTPPVPAALRAEYAPPRTGGFQQTETKTEDHGHYRLRQVELTAPPSPYATNKTILLDCFIPAGTDPTPVLLLLPILGGKDYPLERYFAKYFVKHGFASVIVRREAKGKPGEAAQIEGWLRQTLLDNTLALDWIETQPAFDRDRVGLFGISMGGIKGAMLTPLDHRIKASVLGLAGQDLPYILTETREPGIERRRKRFLQETNMTAIEFQQALEEGLTCDPAIFAPYVDPSKTLLVLALTDTVVPIRKGLELRRNMGRPATVFVFAGHYSSLLYIHYIRHHCLKFLKSHL